MKAGPPEDQQAWFRCKALRWSIFFSPCRKMFWFETQGVETALQWESTHGTQPCFLSLAGTGVWGQLVLWGPLSSSLWNGTRMFSPLTSGLTGRRECGNRSSVGLWLCVGGFHWSKSAKLPIWFRWCTSCLGRSHGFSCVPWNSCWNPNIHNTRNVSVFGDRVTNKTVKLQISH